MKKILVASSALVAVAFAGQAQASEKIKLSVGGYMEQWMGVADQDSGESVNAFQSDTEIHFKGSTTLDNGIEVGAVVELEGETSDDQVDEEYLYINGGFGQVKLGKEDGAADDMGITAPSVGPVGVNDGDLTNWVSAYLPDTVPSTGDHKRVTYYTPSLSGFRAGVSYADDDTSNNNDTATTGDNVISAGLEYNADFDGWSLGLSATGENEGEGNWYGLGANVGFGNFTVGGSWGHIEDDFGLTERDAAGSDTDTFDVGVSYAMDAAAVSLSYAYSEYGNRSTTGGASNEGEMSTVDLGLAYTLGAGVSWNTSVFWFDDDNNNASFDNDGYGAVTGLRLDF
ncbi:porin [Thalassospira xiamenensis]|uniref:Outer membrane protein (Porin) n=1 Tax=Thalassospira xiamenensis TaxID=220697 RepID=A0A285T7R8_9PROT|nr:porin [Thalassospira xiamenensis]SOC17356.1 Outer membrane protein (porin) [Thalassospira xiamenensis]